MGKSDGTDRDLGWEDVSGNINSGSSSGAHTAAIGAEVPGLSDAVTSAMVNHFARELTSSSMSLWPQFMQTVRKYFNVTHGYVLRKMLWQLFPSLSMKKKSAEGELGEDKDWTARVVDGLEVDLEEPDMYIPTMGFVTYVVLYGMVRGLQDNFSPEVLSATITFTLVALIFETTVVKAILFMSGAVNTPTVDLFGLLGYKLFYLSVYLFFGLLLGRGYRPTGFIFTLISLGLNLSCGVALWQALRRLARMQPSHGPECMTDLYSMSIKGLPVFQALVCWLLLPSWPKQVVLQTLQEAAPEIVTLATTTVAAVVTETLQSAD